MINPNFGFTVNWAKANINPGNIVSIESNKKDNLAPNIGDDLFNGNDLVLIGHAQTDDGKDKFLASDVWSGELIDSANSIELLGIRLRGHYISHKAVNIGYVYSDIKDFAIDNW